ncbi:hypothetical protein [Paenibacillus oryzisoli]|nr:hypothetical protein [Paenibacillus oryzisoli]
MQQNLSKPTLPSSNIVQLQQAYGNRATEQWVKSRYQSDQSIQRKISQENRMGMPSNVVQLRGENPHEQAGSHGGWELTAHHIVAHSKLEKALEKLRLKEEAGDGTPFTDVLVHAVPDKLTKSMLEKLKVDVPDSDEKREAYRQMLLDKSKKFDDTEYNVRIGEVRKSFYEWQGGNQYMGPNTSIRAEPTSNKDDIDFDGKYFGNLSKDKFNQLTALGGKLEEEGEQGNIAANLKAILDITKNETPNVFDGTKWKEIDSLDNLISLFNNTDLDRKHILKYSYFKMGLDEIGAGNKYADITYSSADGHKYKGLPIEMQVKGTSGFTPVAKSQEVVPKEETSKLLAPLLTGDLGVALTVSGNNYVIPVDDDKIKVEGKKFKVKGYDDMIPFLKTGAGTIEAAKGMVDNKQMKVVTTLDSLYTYFEKAGTSTSSYLPMELYDVLMAKKV